MSESSYALSGDFSISGYYGPPVTGWTPTVTSDKTNGWTGTIPVTTTVPLPQWSVASGAAIGSGGWQAYPSYPVSPASPIDSDYMKQWEESLRQAAVPALSEDELEMLEATNKWKKFFGM